MAGERGRIEDGARAEAGGSNSAGSPRDPAALVPTASSVGGGGRRNVERPSSKAEALQTRTPSGPSTFDLRLAHQPSPASPSRRLGPSTSKSRPIGVFDSGIGGLTVVAALRELLPAENIFYIGDTARVPYGGKSAATIERYSMEISGLLLAEQAKIIVVACNTASALGVPRLQETLKIPVIGVIVPGAQAAVRATRSGRIGVIGTRATIYSRAYERAIHELEPKAKVISCACPLLVPLIEEGWLNDPIADQVIRRYLEGLVREEIDTLVLGCTHYPLLRTAIQNFVGPAITLVDSAQNCANAVKELLEQAKLAAPKSHLGQLQVAVTDTTDGFLHVAEKALGLQVGDVHLRTVQGVAAS